MANSIGRAIADYHHTLLVESDDPITADYHVVAGMIESKAHAYIEVHRLFSHLRDFGTALPPDTRFVGYSEPPGKLEQDDLRLWARVGAVAGADVVLLLGGSTGTNTFGCIASDLRVPIVAIPSMGAVAKEWFDRCLTCYKSRSDVQHLLNAIYSPDDDRDPGKLIIQFAELYSRKQSYFLGYSHENAVEADHVETLFRRKNRVVFRDDALLRLGAQFELDIKRQLRCSDTYVGLWSESFSRSEWCVMELQWAIELQLEACRPRRVHLILLDETPLPDEFASQLHALGNTREARIASFHRVIDEE
ncbi:MAG: TIR domain-containing protein [Pirellula sp.]